MFKFGGPIDNPKWVYYEHDLSISCATSFRARFLGLHAWGQWGETPKGLMFFNCNGVHTIGLKLCIDIVYFNKALQIIDTRINVSPNKICFIAKAKHILELPSGYCLSNNWQNQVATGILSVKNIAIK